MTPTPRKVVVVEGRLHKTYWSPSTKPISLRGAALAKAAIDDASAIREAHAIAAGKTPRALKGQRAYVAERIIESLVLDVLAFEKTRRTDVFVVNLETAWLTSGPSDQPARSRSVAKRVKELVDAGWLVQITHKGDNGAVTSTEAGPRLLEVAHALDVDLVDVGIDRHAPDIVLKGEKPSFRGVRPLIKQKDTRELASIRADLFKLNEMLNTADVAVCDGAKPLDTRVRSCSRVFIDNSYKASGRLTGGFWLELKKEDRRKDLRIDGQCIAEVDIKSAMPSILYAIESEWCQGDFYDLSSIGVHDIPRAALKPVLMKMLWQKIDSSSRLPRPKSADDAKIPDHYSAQDVFGFLRDRNAPVAHKLGAECPIGAYLMHLESEIIIKATRQCFAEGFTALPLHDALLTSAAAATRARDILIEAFVDVAGLPPIVEVSHFISEALHP
jgi:hypothetical protein